MLCSIPAIHMKKMAVTQPLLATPEIMIDAWRQSYAQQQQQPTMEFIHAVRDIKKYFDKEGKDGIDKLFGGYAGSKVCPMGALKSWVIVCCCLQRKAESKRAAKKQKAPTVAEAEAEQAAAQEAVEEGGDEAGDVGEPHTGPA